MLTTMEVFLGKVPLMLLVAIGLQLFSPSTAQTTTTTPLSWSQIQQQTHNETEEIHRLAILEDSLDARLQRLLDVGYRPASCQEVHKYNTDNGVHTLTLTDNTTVRAYCDQKIDEGEWTVIQRRRDGSVDFYRNWNEYEQGFGDPVGEYWLGLRAIHLMTAQQNHSLRVDMRDAANRTSYATYHYFYVTGADDNYTKHTSDYNGNSSDSFRGVVAKFSTFDRDNDARHDQNCAHEYQTGWWMSECGFSNLNGPYNPPELGSGYQLNGTVWDINGIGGKPNYLTWVEMKIRPN